MSPKAAKAAKGGEVTPFKVVGQLIGSIRNAKGEIVGEKVIGEVAIYRPDFGRLEDLIAEAMAENPPEPEAP